MAEKPRTAQDLVNRLGKGTRDVLLDRLAERGLVERRDGKVLGLFPHTTWPARDARHEESVRALLQGALVQGLTPTPGRRRWSRCSRRSTTPTRSSTAATCRPGRSRPAPRRSPTGAWAAKAVKDAVAAAQAAITAAVMASIAAATAAGS